MELLLLWLASRNRPQEHYRTAGHVREASNRVHRAARAVPEDIAPIGPRDSESAGQCMVRKPKALNKVNSGRRSRPYHVHHIRRRRRICFAQCFLPHSSFQYTAQPANGSFSGPQASRFISSPQTSTALHGRATFELELVPIVSLGPLLSVLRRLMHFSSWSGWTYLELKGRRQADMPDSLYYVQYASSTTGFLFHHFGGIVLSAFAHLYMKASMLLTRTYIADEQSPRTLSVSAPLSHHFVGVLASTSIQTACVI